MADLSAIAKAVRAERLTYLSDAKMDRLEQEALRVLGYGVRGAVAEFGLALGGSAIVLAAHARRYDRRFLGFDVFGMIPPPASAKDDETSKARYTDIAAGKSQGMQDDLYYGYRPDLLAEVSASFAAHAMPVDGRYVTLVKGLFEETWRGYRCPLAFAHIDCDWFDPVSFTLDAARDQLSAGGSLVIDDYHAWSGARTATDEFLKANPDFSFHDGPNVVLRRAV